MLPLQYVRQQFHFNDLQFCSVEQSKTSDQPLDFVAEFSQAILPIYQILNQMKQILNRDVAHFQ